MRHIPAEMRPLVWWRVSVAAAFCLVPGMMFLRMQAQVTVEALRGNAFDIGPPHVGAVLGVALPALLALPTAAVVYILLSRPRAGAVAALMHDALLVGLLAQAAWALSGGVQYLEPGARELLGLLTCGVGAFAAEAVWLGLTLRLPVPGLSIAGAYVLCVLAIGRQLLLAA
jgi:hypothetical protein